MNKERNSGIRILMLLLISSFGLSAEGIRFNVADPEKGIKINMEVSESDDFISRHYAFNGSFKVYKTKILFKGREDSFYSDLLEKSDAVSAAHSVFSIGTGSYITIFVLFADSTIKYYTYEKNDLYSTCVVKIESDRFQVYSDSKIDIIKFDTDAMKYAVKVFSLSKDAMKIFQSDMIITCEE